MIRYKEGDIVSQEAEALVNTVNCVGIMGRGIALSFREKYPENYNAYKTACQEGKVELGKMFIFHRGTISNPKIIINFPTKYHWRENSKIEYIENGLDDLVSVLKKYDIKSVVIPPLGCGLGGLDWNVVRPLIIEKISELKNTDVILFKPTSKNIEPFVSEIHNKPALTIARAGLLALMGKYRSALMDTKITLLEIHKLMYFFQETGEPLKLSYVKANHGPYAENLRHLLSKMNNAYIKGYNNMIDSPTNSIELIGSADIQGVEYLQNPDRHISNERLEKVIELIEGFESPFGMELLATVHWLCVHEGVSTLEELIQKTHEWSPQKKKLFDVEHIELAWATLKENKWINT